MSGCRIARDSQAPEPEARVLRGHVCDVHRPVVGGMLANPREVVLPERRARHDAEPVLGKPCDGEVALDPATAVEHLGVGHAPDLAGDAVRAEPFEELGRPLARHVDLRERRLVEERRRLAAGDVLGADRRRPQLPRPAARAQRLVPAHRVRLEPVRTLPARLLAEHGPELHEPRVRRREAQRPARLPLVAGVLHVVVRLVDLLRAGERVLRATDTRRRSASSPCARRRATAFLRRSTRRRACPSLPRPRARGRRSLPRPRTRGRRRARG